MIKIGENGERTVISMDEFLKEKKFIRKFNTNRNLWLVPYGKEKKINKVEDMKNLEEMDDFERELKKLSDEIEAKNKKKKSKYCTVTAVSENYKIYDLLEKWCEEKD